MMKLLLARALPVFVLMCAPVTAIAQEQENQEGKGGRRLIVLPVASALYDANTRTTGEVGVLVPLTLGMDEDAVFLECRCLEATAGLGPGGSRFTVGPSFRGLWRPIFPYGWDALLTVKHTSDSPRAGIPNSTYVGAEAGFVYLSARIGVGVAHRVSGPGPRDTVFTWNVGVRTVW